MAQRLNLLLPIPHSADFNPHGGRTERASASCPLIFFYYDPIVLTIKNECNKNFKYNI